MTLRLALVGLFYVAMGEHALAQQPPSAEAQNMLAQADANGDGNLEWAEVTSMRLEMFSRLDRNGDGFADEDDTPGLMGRNRYLEALGNLLPRFDSNEDQRISKDEMLNGPSPAFTLGDLNGDKVLSAAELQELRERDPRPASR